MPSSRSQQPTTTNMLLGDEPFSPSRIPWHHRRVQRCIGFAVFFLLVLLALLFREDKLPIVADLNLDSLKTGLHHYTSTHESGGPAVPLDDNSENQADRGPLYDVPQGGYQELSTEMHTPGVATTGTGKLALDPTKIALLLETRAISHLPALIAHFISVLPPDWTVRFVGSKISLGMAKHSVSLQHHIRSGKLVLTDLPKKYPIDSQEAISATLTDLSFYKEFLAPAEWVLMFQSDSIICSASEHNIEEWVSKKHTWVGAPWHLGNQWGGNGGLSLRHIPPIIKLLEKETRVAKSEWEDRWLCDRLGLLPEANMPPPAVEREFSVEGIWTDRPFGYHLRGSGLLLAGEIWGDAKKRQQVFDYCPEIKIVLDMDLLASIDAMKKELAELKKQIAKIPKKAKESTSKEIAEDLEEEEKEEKTP